MLVHECVCVCVCMCVCMCVCVCDLVFLWGCLQSMVLHTVCTCVHVRCAFCTDFLIPVYVKWLLSCVLSCVGRFMLYCWKPDMGDMQLGVSCQCLHVQEPDACIIWLLIEGANVCM